MKVIQLLKLVRQAIKDEPEYPGEPPEEMMEILMSGDRELIIEALRLSVKLTKQGILVRIVERLEDEWS